MQGLLSCFLGFRWAEKGAVLIRDIKCRNVY